MSIWRVEFVLDNPTTRAKLVRQCNCKDNLWELPILRMHDQPDQREQVRTNTAIKILRMKDVCFIQKVGF
jgi:hypothetical protein